MKKKILIIIPSLEIGGGAEKLTSLLTIRLSQNFDIFILTFFNSKKLYPFKGKYYSLKENTDSSKKLLDFMRINEFLRPFRIYKFINLLSPDIILSFTDFANFTTILTKLLFRINIPLIIAVRCNPTIEYKEKNRHVNFLIKKLYRLKIINKIVVVSKELQNILEKGYHINRNKIITIYNGIDLEEIRQMKNSNIIENREIFYNQNLIKFVIVGRLHEEKGHKYLIEAFDTVKKKINRSKLIIIGDGEDKFKLKKNVKEKNLEDDVLFLGLKKNPFKYLAQSDIFILSSKNEGFPNVLLEAMACGLPIIATNCKTGPKEILDDGNYGFLVKVKDSKNLAEKMAFLANDKALMNEYSKKSLKRAEFFNIDKILKQWIKLINENLT